jgi:hypothetical protein
LERYLADFLAFFFPQAHGDIDWSRGYTFLDKELQQVVRDAELGRRLADELVQVWLHDGAETWVLVHIEIQTQEEGEFARRMFTYHYRLFDRYNRQVVSLAVLGDDRADWRPDHFGYDLWGCTMQLVFPVVKLLDYRPKRDILETNRNPFATIVLTHLVAQDTRQAPDRRAQAKFALTRRLYELGYSRQAVLDLYRFIDWLLRLPEDLEQLVWQQIKDFEEERQMTYLSYAERQGLEQGLEQGRAEGRAEGLSVAIDAIVLALDLKFGGAALPVMDEIRQISDLAMIEQILASIKSAPTLEAVRRVYVPRADA